MQEKFNKLDCISVLCDITNGLMAKYKNINDTVENHNDLYVELKGLENWLTTLNYLDKQ